MQWALEQYNEKRTTMAESIKQANDLDYPILVFCAEPGFKPSFFKTMKWNSEGIEKLLWKYPAYQVFLQNVSSISDVYENMSYIFGIDWTIGLLPTLELDEDR